MAIRSPPESDVELSVLPHSEKRHSSAIEGKTAFDRKQSNTEFLAFPEGGLRAWLVVLGSFCGMSVTFSQNQVFDKC
jgi:hypothetical protein